jgi:hypothetical protein
MFIRLNCGPGRKGRRSLTNSRWLGPAPEATPSATVSITERRDDSLTLCNNQRRSRPCLVTFIHEYNTKTSAVGSKSFRRNIQQRKLSAGYTEENVNGQFTSSDVGSQLVIIPMAHGLPWVDESYLTVKDLPVFIKPKDSLLCSQGLILGPWATWFQFAS